MKNKNFAIINLLVSVFTFLTTLLTLIIKIQERKSFVKAVENEETVNVLEISKKDTKILE